MFRVVSRNIASSPHKQFLFGGVKATPCIIAKVNDTSFLTTPSLLIHKKHFTTYPSMYHRNAESSNVRSGSSVGDGGGEVSSMHYVSHNEEAEDPYAAPDVKTNIKAFYVGRSINIAKAHRDFCSDQPHRFKRDFIMISFPPPPPPPPPPIEGKSTSSSSSTASISPDDPFTKISDSTFVTSSDKRNSADSDSGGELGVWEIQKNNKYTTRKEREYQQLAAADVFGFEKEIKENMKSDSNGNGKKTNLGITSKNKNPLSSSPHAGIPFGNKHMAVFNYGSVVFFNFNDVEIQKMLNDLKPYTTDLIPREFQITEDYTIAERPYLTEPCVLRNDLTILRELDFHGATVISTIMAQTVALDHFSMLVDQMLEIFTEFNMSVEKTGQFMAIKRNDLFKLVAQNNAVLIAVLSKLSLLERSDTAWKMPAYVHVWEGLREEFEIDDRFDNLKYKLNLIQDNTKFFLEIMHNQKSNMLEWIIIVLITAECGLMVMDMAGLTPGTVSETIAATVLP